MNTLFTLILSVCLLHDPQKCHEENVALSDEVRTQFQCMMTTQPMIAQWNAEPRHSSLYVKRWTCREGKFANL